MTHPTLERIAAWVEGLEDEAETEALDLHLLECGACSAQAERLQELVAKLRGSVPAVLTEARHGALQAKYGRLPATHVTPGQTGQLTLSDTKAVGLWVMHCDLSGVTRLDIEAHDENGAPVFKLPDVPFDAERGQVLLACQVHYRAMPTGQLLRATVRDASGGEPRQLAEYFLDHRFENP